MNLQNKAEALLSEVKCRRSVLCRGLDDAEPLISINRDETLSSASTIKVPILMALISHADAGDINLEQAVDVRHILDDTKVFEYGGRKASLRELAVWMIILSDNTSTNALIDFLGFDAINGFIASLGLRNTALRRKMLDFASREAGIDNTTTAEDMFFLFKRIFRDERDKYREAADILRRQRSKEMLARYIWEDVKIAHKSGALDYLTHDAGVMTVKGKEVFAGAFLWDTEDIEGDPRLIGRIGRAIYDYLNGGE